MEPEEYIKLTKEWESIKGDLNRAESRLYNIEEKLKRIKYADLGLGEQKKERFITFDSKHYQIGYTKEGKIVVRELQFESKR